MNANKVFVLGLDGATFDLINPWCDSGYLPNIKGLLRESAYGILMSTPDPNSAQAWSSFITGVNPGKHGLYYFVKRKKDSYDVELTNASIRKAKSMWRTASEYGKKCIVVNVPMTYPPEEINGILLSGIDAPGTISNYTFPPGLAGELKSEIGGYIIESNAISLIQKGKYLEALEELKRNTDNRYHAIKYLMKKYPWELFVVVFVATDRVQHHFWKFMNPSHPLFAQKDDRLRNGIREIYQKMDEIVGMIRNNLDEETTLVIMSDHGAGPSTNKTVYINKWLRSIGLLRYRDEAQPNPLKALYVRAKSTLTWNIQLFLKKTLSQHMKDLLRKHFHELANKVKSYRYDLSIDWLRTKAYSWETGPHIWLNVQGREPQGTVKAGDEYEALRDFIIRELRKLRDPETGEEVVGSFNKREDIYHGKYLDEAPDILFEWKNHAYVHRFSRSNKKEAPIQILSFEDLEFAEFASRPSGIHRGNGILIMNGNGIQKGVSISGAKIEDLTPTILYLLGIDIPKDFDGKILQKAIDQKYWNDFPPCYTESTVGEEKGEPKGVYSGSDTQEIKERLRGLGYIE